MIWSRIDAVRAIIDAYEPHAYPEEIAYYRGALTRAESYAASQWIGAALDLCADITAAIHSTNPSEVSR